MYFENPDLGPNGHGQLGPDVMVVLGARSCTAEKWVCWKEGLVPNWVLETLSPSTQTRDLRTKRDLYGRVIGVPEYVTWDPFQTRRFQLWRLTPRGDRGRYERVAPDSRGRCRSEELGLDVGTWHGAYQNTTRTWLRLFHPDGRLLETAKEAADREAGLRLEAERAATHEAALRSDAERAATLAERAATHEAGLRLEAERRVAKLEALLRESGRGRD